MKRMRWEKKQGEQKTRSRGREDEMGRREGEEWEPGAETAEGVENQEKRRGG